MFNAIGAHEVAKEMSSRKPVILFLDDSPHSLVPFTWVLREKGFRVHLCDHWAEVSKMAREYKPDLIMVDYNMPSLKGDIVCHELKMSSANPNMKVVMFSAEDEAVVKQKAEECGADGFIPKIPPASAVIDRITALLNSAA